jgi:hypothetical protein
MFLGWFAYREATLSSLKLEFVLEGFHFYVVGALGTVLGPLVAANSDGCGYRIQEGQGFSSVNVVLLGVAVWAQGLDMSAGLPSVIKNLFCVSITCRNSPQ